MKKLYCGWLGILTILALSGPVSLQAQSEAELAPVSGTYAITNVNIIQGPGRKIDMGTIVIKDGLISNVGKNISIPADAIIIKADSMYVYAGFIDGLSYAGVVKPKPDNNRERPEDPGNPEPEEAGITPSADVRNSLSASEKSIEDLRNQGFTAAHVIPYGGMLPGNGAIILLGGKSVDNMVLINNSSLASEISPARRVYPGTAMGVMAKYRELYKQASQSNSYASMYAANPKGLQRPVNDRVLEAFYPVINKRQPVLFKADDVLEAQRVLALKRELGFNLILAGLKEGWDITGKIKAANAQVFLSLDLPDAIKKEKGKKDEGSAEKKALEKRREEFMAKYEGQAATFSKAGIKFGFATMDAKASDLRENMRRMIAAGLSEDAMLAALTTSPAELLGIANRVGTVDNGKIANLVISDKPYFEEKSKVRYVFVDGKVHKLDTKERPKGDANAKVEVGGSWTMVADTPQGKNEWIIKIVKDGGSLRGTVSSDMMQGTTDCNEVTIDGNILSYSYPLTLGGNSVTIEVTGTVEGDSFSGTVTAGSFGSFPVEGSRNPDK